MVYIPKENIHAARTLLLTRIHALYPEVQEIARRGFLLGPNHESEIIEALSVLDDELDGLEEGIVVLDSLLRR